MQHGFPEGPSQQKGIFKFEDEAMMKRGRAEKSETGTPGTPSSVHGVPLILRDKFPVYGEHPRARAIRCALT
jgi:hypothetical protein